VSTSVPSRWSDRRSSTSGPAGWRLYLSCATPGSKHWWIEALDAPAPEAFSSGVRTTCLPGDESLALKDPVVEVTDQKYPSLDALPKGATIALLNDPANTAQALWILERAGKLTFKDGVNPWEATEKDIAQNIGGYKFTYMEYGAGPRTLPSVDAVIDYNMSFVDAGTPEKDRIYAPPAPREFAGQLVVVTGVARAGVLRCAPSEIGPGHFVPGGPGSGGGAQACDHAERADHVGHGLRNG